MRFRPVSIEGHFGEWLQGRLGPDGPVALVTLRCATLAVTAPFEGATEPLFTDGQLSAFFDILGLPHIWPETQHTMPPGGGAGASTATLVALARSAGFDGDTQLLAEACIAVEGASDPLMFDAPDTLLWASRYGHIVETFAPPPACEIFGGFWGDPLRTDPTDDAFPDISDLIDPWRGALVARDLARAAELATVSADRSTALRGPDDPMRQLADDLGALGHIRAHTGSARGLIFAAGHFPNRAEDALRAAGLKDVLQFGTGAP